VCVYNLWVNESCPVMYVQYPGVGFDIDRCTSTNHSCVHIVVSHDQTVMIYSRLSKHVGSLRLGIIKIIHSIKYIYIINVRHNYITIGLLQKSRDNLLHSYYVKSLQHNLFGLRS